LYSLIAICLSDYLFFLHNNVLELMRCLCSGEAFDWAQFKLPKIRSKYGWLLAGGINPKNVCEALSTLKPEGVDVSSGICASDGIQKDQSRIASFMDAVHSVQY
jgi:phosphoribosylanthranilate isomerase